MSKSTKCLNGRCPHNAANHCVMVWEDCPHMARVLSAALVGELEGEESKRAESHASGIAFIIGIFIGVAICVMFWS